MAIDINARASLTAVDTVFKNTGVRGNFLPQRIAVIGQGNDAEVYSTDKKLIESAFEVGQLYGFGSPLHLVVDKLLPANGDGVGSIPITVYPLPNEITGIAAQGSITPSGAVSEESIYRIFINNIPSKEFVILPGDAIADIIDKMVIALNSIIEMPVIGTDNTSDLGVTAKWKGESGNDLYIEVEGPTNGLTFVIVQPTGGAVNPEITIATNQFGNVWETLILNCLNKTDLVALNAYKSFGEGRWQSTVRKPFVAFCGDTNETVSAATTIPDARKDDRINSQLVSPAGKDLPFLVAARQLARIVVVAENNPPKGYNGQIADTLTPPGDSYHWDWDQRDEALKKGSSTSTVENGEVVCGDIATFYHPDGQPIPAYRYVVNIVKLQNIIYNMDLIFESAEWRDVPLVDNNEPTINPEAKTPASAKAEVAQLLDFLASWAIITNSKEAKKKTIVTINNQNPDRIDIIITVQLSGNTRIKAVTLNFGYFVGNGRQQ